MTVSNKVRATKTLVKNELAIKQQFLIKKKNKTPESVLLIYDGNWWQKRKLKHTYSQHFSMTASFWKVWK